MLASRSRNFLEEFLARISPYALPWRPAGALRFVALLHSASGAGTDRSGARAGPRRQGPMETPPQQQPARPEPTVYVRELYPGVVAKGMGLPPGEWAHFRIQVPRRGADLEVKLKHTFGGVPAVLLTFGDLPDEARTDEEFLVDRNEKNGQDAGDATELVVPWREVGRNDQCHAHAACVRDE
jgi:hypothetical protein